MSTEHANRARILDVREQRKASGKFEFREDASSGNYVLNGYAATFSPYDVYGGPDRGGWVEQLTPRAFDRTLGERPDVQLLLNHEGLPLARTKSGTLGLSVDSHGLRIRAELDPSDPDVQALAPKMRRHDIDEMSFAFRVKDQVWDNDYTNRTITEVSLHKGDVSVVNFGMNPGTRAMLEQGVEALSSLSHKELVELRKLDPDLLHRAEVALMSERGWRANGEHDFNDGICITCADANARAADKPHGDVKYADPGYLDASGNPAKGDNGVARYPIDEKHVQAAWSYINMPKNQKGYTSSQLASIKSKIRSAMKRFGHDVAEEKEQPVPETQRNQPAAMVSHYDMVRNIDGGTTMIAVLTDGSRTVLPGSPASPLITGSAPAPGDKRLGGITPYVWDPFGSGTHPDPHDDEYEKDSQNRALMGDEECEEQDEECEEEGRAAPRVSEEMAEYEGTDTKAILSADDDEDEHEEQLGAGPINVERALHEFRSANGVPDIVNVSEGLAYLRRA